jgi:CRP-like cAMP-binding protein
MSAKSSLENLYRVLSAIQPVSEKFRRALEKEIISLAFPANHKLLEAPRISDHVFFLDTGLAMTYRFVNGEKLIEKFWAAGEIILSVRSFFEQVPTVEFIELLSRGDVLFISHKSLNALAANFPEVDYYYRAVMNQYHEQAADRIHDIQHFTSLEHLKKLLLRYPTLEQHISQEQIASYLGIAPQSLSRLKRIIRNSEH